MPAGSASTCHESPGGKVDPGESHHEALRREGREELGIEIGRIPEHALWCGEVASPNGGARVSLYLVTEWAGEPTPREGQGIGWFEACEIPALVMTPANVAAMAEVVRAVDASAGNARRAVVPWSSIEETVRAAGATTDVDCTACGKPAEFISGSAGCTVLCATCIAGAPDGIPRVRLDGSEPNAAWVASVESCACVGDGCTGPNDGLHVCVTGNACGVAGCPVCGGVESTAAEVVGAMSEQLRQLAADPARREAFNAARPCPTCGSALDAGDPCFATYAAGRASRDEDVAALRAENERLEALFQQTHGCHHSWAEEYVSIRTERDDARTMLDLAEGENAALRAEVKRLSGPSDDIWHQIDRLAERVLATQDDIDRLRAESPAGQGTCERPTNVFCVVDGKLHAGVPAEPTEWR